MAEPQSQSQSQPVSQKCNFCQSEAQHQCVGCYAHLCDTHLWIEEYRPLCPVCSGDMGVQEMLDRNREIEHRCFQGHTWRVFAALDGNGVVSYGNILDALCPHCQKQAHLVRLAQAGAIAIQLLGALRSVTPTVYHLCLNRKCLRTIYTPMEPAPNIALTAYDKLTGVSYWRIPVPFPLYCPECSASRVVARQEWIDEQKA